MSDSELSNKLNTLSVAENEEDTPSFDPTLKKKKKKKVVAFADDVEPEQPSGETAEQETAEAEADLDPATMFSDKKKKKKKKKVEDVVEEAGPSTTEANTEEVDEADEEGEEVDDDEENKASGDELDKIEEAEETWHGTDRDYTYTELLTRVFKIIREKNPELFGEKRRYTIVPPQVAREGSKKTIFGNLADICRRLHRDIEHVVQFLFTELGTSGSIDGSQRLVIKGRFQQKQIEVIIRRYIVEYVTCKTCKSPETKLSKENRLLFLQCDSCGSTRSVSGVKSGYQANLVKRSKRKPV